MRIGGNAETRRRTMTVAEEVAVRQIRTGSERHAKHPADVLGLYVYLPIAGPS